MSNTLTLASSCARHHLIYLTGSGTFRGTFYKASPETLSLNGWRLDLKSTGSMENLVAESPPSSITLPSTISSLSPYEFGQKATE